MGTPQSPATQKQRAGLEAPANEPHPSSGVSLTSRDRRLQEKRQSLPIARYRNAINDLVRDNLLVIIIGETGSGKSTQIPQYLFDDDALAQTMLLQKPRTKPLLTGAQQHPEQEDDSQCQESTPPPRLRLCVTQPRRMAAIAMAKRVAEERRCSLGTEVGYAIRFDDHSSPTLTHIKYVTDGVALREVLENGSFAKYNVFIVDEAHERTLNTDILFALIKKTLQHYKAAEQLPPLRFVITSATLDAVAFSSFFNNAPVLEVPGRCFPVDIFYSPVHHTKHLAAPLSTGREQATAIAAPRTTRSESPRTTEMQGDAVIPSSAALVDAAVNAALRLHLLPPEEGGGTGHILVFLTGRAECDAACELALHRLKELLVRSPDREIGDAAVIPLYGALSSEDQALVFEPAEQGCRKIIFSTNVAETSVTVEDVEFVVDMGLVKQKSCNPKTGVDTLTVVWIAKSQATQRMGRAGRSKSGKCVRVYSDVHFEEMLDNPVREIHRTNLSSLVLQLKCLGFHNVLDVEFLDPPPKEALLTSLKQLYFLGALSETCQLTPLGRQMVSLPLDPIHARCLLAAVKYRCVSPVSAIIAMLSVDHVWIRPFIPHTCRTSDDNTSVIGDSTLSTTDKERLRSAERASRRHQTFVHPMGDHLTLLNVFKAFIQLPSHRQREWCRNNFLQYRSLAQARDIYHQLMGLASDAKLRHTMDSADDNEFPAPKRMKNAFFTPRNEYRHSGSHTTREPSSPCQLIPDSSEEYILKALCQGFFVNAAKLSATSLVGSALWTDAQNKASSDRWMPHLWVTLKDGLLLRYEPMTAYAAPFWETLPPDYVVFSEAVGWGADGRHPVRKPGSSGNAVIGFMRVASHVRKEWLQNLIPRLTHLDLRTFASLKTNPPSNPSTTSAVQPFQIQIEKHPLGNPEVDKAAEDLAEKRREAARLRYLARRSRVAQP